MTIYGVTATGFVAKRQPEILAELEQDAKLVFGEDLNLEPESTFGQYLGVMSERFTQVWELAKAAHDAYDPAAAIGQRLSALGVFKDITRLEADATTVTLTFNGNAGAIVPAVTQVKSDSGAIFETDIDLLLTGAGDTVTATATETGPIPANVNTINTLVNPVSGVQNVDNLTAGDVGRDEETDQEFRQRFFLSTGSTAQNILDSLYSQAINTVGVDFARVYANKTAAVDGNGLLPHSFMLVVEGGDDQALLNLTWLNTPGGMASQGNTAGVVADAAGTDQAVFVERPGLVPIYVDIVTTKVAGRYPADGDEDMRDAVIDYASGALFLEGQGGEAGFPVGADVKVARLYTPVNTIQGHTIDSIEISDVSFAAAGTADVVIAFNELSTFTLPLIRINGVVGP